MPHAGYANHEPTPSTPPLSATRARRRERTRALVFALAATLCAGAIGPATTTAAATSPRTAGTLVPTEPVSGMANRSDRGSLVARQPAPIAAERGGGTGFADPSVHLRVEDPATVRPTRRTEITDKRTANSRTIAETDGSYTVEVSPGRMHFRDANGTWQPLDLSLVPDAVDGLAYRVAASDRAVRFGTANGVLASVTGTDGTLRIRLPGARSGARDGTANRVRFAAAGTEPEVVAQPSDTGFEFHAIVPDASVAPASSVILDAGGLGVTLAPDGRTVLLSRTAADAAGAAVTTVVGVISAPVLLEGGEDGAPAADQSAVKVRIIGSADARAALGLRRTEVLLRYELDPTWLADPARRFPVVIDPKACIGAGSGGESGCDLHNTGAIDHFIMSAQPDSVPSSWTRVRVGYDNRSDDGGVYGTMRSLFYFKDVSLPDGAYITSSSVRLQISSEYGNASGQTMKAWRITRMWDTGTSNGTWNKLTSPAVAWTSSGEGSATLPASGSFTIGVTDITRAWYTRRAKDWKADYGIVLKMGSEGANYGEVLFRRGDDGTLAYRPLLQINYDIGKVKFAFDTPTLGAEYAPSSMVAGVASTIPVRFKNNSSGYTYNKRTTGSTDYWVAGYRFFNQKGELVDQGGSTYQDLPADITSGTWSSFFPLSITPPATPDQYTLRIDLARVRYGTPIWMSDWAWPSKYYSRDKTVLTPDNTRWTGSSLIERAEFPITVTAGEGAGDLVKTVGVGNGDHLGINIGTQNLRYEGDSGLAVNDLVPLGFRYGYDSKTAAAGCTGYLGILGACGWWTSWDERVIDGSGDGSYVYLDPTGDRIYAATDGQAQVTSNGDVLIERPRATWLDDAIVTGWAGSTPSLSNTRAYTGTRSTKISSTAGAPYTYAVEHLNLNSYRNVTFAVSMSGTTRASLQFRVQNLDAGWTKWFAYTLGGSFSTGARRGAQHQPDVHGRSLEGRDRAQPVRGRAGRLRRL